MTQWTVDRAPYNPGWEPEECFKDGKRIAGRDPGDWHAVLKTAIPTEATGRPLYMLLQFGSEPIPAMEEAEAVVLRVLAGLNYADQATAPAYRTQKEADGTWSAYEGAGFRKGGFPRQEMAINWMIERDRDHREAVA